MLNTIKDFLFFNDEILRVTTPNHEHRVPESKRVSTVLPLQTLNLNRKFKWGQRVTYQASLKGMHNNVTISPLGDVIRLKLHQSELRIVQKIPKFKSKLLLRIYR